MIVKSMLCVQLMYPDRVEGLMLINCTASQAGWVEWGYQKVILRNCLCCHDSSASLITLLELTKVSDYI